MIPDMFLIDYDPFAMESRVAIVNDGMRSFVSVSSDISSLAKELPALCDTHNQYNVRFHAPTNAFYELKRQLEDVEKDTYGESKINLEIC